MKLLATSITAEQPLLKLHRTTEYFITDINRCQEIHVQQWYLPDERSLGQHRLTAGAVMSPDYWYERLHEVATAQHETRSIKQSSPARQ